MMKIGRTGLAVVLLAAGAGAQEWTQFRGPNGSGISAAKGIPVQWTEKDFRWRVKLSGESHSQPVVWGEKIFVLSAQDQGRERMLLCLNKQDGKELWSKKYPMATHKKHDLNSFASSSPAVDKDRVYALFATPDQFLVKAWDHAGKEAWTANLGPFVSQHGVGTSPILYDGKLIVPNDQDGESFVVALDVKTGKPVWRCPRESAKEGAAYGTPVLFLREGASPELLLSSRANGISSINPQTGKPNWEAKVFTKRAVSSPVVAGNLVIGTCGQGSGGTTMAAIKMGGKGDVTSSHQAWSIAAGVPYVPTPVAIGERLFVISDTGIATCLEATTGRTIWTERLGGGFFASPVAVDGRIYAVSKQGECVVFEASESFKLVARSPVGEASHTTPCIDGDRIYFKTFTHLVCVGGK